MFDWVLLIGATLLGALALRVWQQSSPAPGFVLNWTSRGWSADILAGATLVATAAMFLLPRYATMNPRLIPFGQDAGDYLRCMLAIREHDPGLWLGQRYPLYPALTVALSALLDRDMADVGLYVSLGSAILTPAAVYVFGRSMLPIFPAWLGSALTVFVSFEPTLLGTINAYPLATLLYVFSLGTLVHALRDGRWQWHALAGTALALYCGSIAKSFPMLWLALGAVVVAALPEKRGGMRSLVAFVLPLLAYWVVFSLLPYRLYPLEGLMYEVHWFEHLLDPNKPFPAVGWNGDTNMGDRGYWIPGHLAALVHLDDVLRYMLFPPIQRLPLAERYDAVVPNMAEYWGWKDAPWTTIAASLGAGVVWLARGAPFRRLVAAATAFATILVHLWSVGETGNFVLRYALPSMLLMPCLALALAALPARGVPFRIQRSIVCWMPLAAAAAWVTGPSPGVFGSDRMEAQLAQTTNLRHPVEEVLELKAKLQPSDVILGIADAELTRALFANHAVQVGRLEMTETGQFRFSAAAVAGRRRWLLFGCIDQGSLDQMAGLTEMYAYLSANASRFQKLERCIFLDNTPSKPIVFAPQDTPVPGSGELVLLGGPGPGP